MSTYKREEVAAEVLEYGRRELKLLGAELRHGWIGGLVVAGV